MGKVILIIGCLFLAGCATTQAGNFCDVSQPIYLTKSDIAKMSDMMVEKVLEHNRYGAKYCGWKK